MKKNDIVTPNKPVGDERVLGYCLVTKEGKVLQRGTVRSSCIDVALNALVAWREIEE